MLPERMLLSRRALALLAAAAAAALPAAADPTPPCAAPFPSAAAPETWCSTVLAASAASGVTVAQYGLPASETLVTAT